MRSKRAAKNNSIKTDARALRNTTRWYKLSSYMRQRYPVCYNPFNEHSVKEATEVHHIFKVSDYPALAYDKDNLVTLCSQCHGTITALEKKNIDTQWLFIREG